MFNISRFLPLQHHTSRSFQHTSTQITSQLTNINAALKSGVFARLISHLLRSCDPLSAAVVGRGQRVDVETTFNLVIM
jgi:hypothetical protein